MSHTIKAGEFGHVIVNGDFTGPAELYLHGQLVGTVPGPLLRALAFAIVHREMAAIVQTVEDEAADVIERDARAPH